MKRWARILARWGWLGIGTIVYLAGCHLYEPERYTRLEFAPGAPATRVLMIGNSLTYTNDLPGLLQQLSAGESAPIYIEKITTPYSSLKFHWDMGVARDRIREGHWNYVVLQEFSRMPVTDRAQSLDYFGRFCDAVRAAGAQPIIFENWTRAGKDDDYATLQDAYRAIAAKTEAPVAPIGGAWHLCGQERPDITLLDDDRHPSDAGTLLAACVLYDTVYHKTSTALPANVRGPELPAGQITALREVADRAVAGAQ